MPEVLNPENGDAGAVANEFVKMNKRSLDFLFGAQKAFLEEMISVNNDVFERTRDELNVATEFVSRLAESHSVKAIMDVCEDCRKHQAEMVRLDNERLFKFGQRVLGRTTGFLTNSIPESSIPEN